MSFSRSPADAPPLGVDSSAGLAGRLCERVGRGKKRKKGVMMGFHYLLTVIRPEDSSYSPKTFWSWPMGPLLFQNESSDARDHCANERSKLFDPRPFAIERWFEERIDTGEKSRI